MPVDLCSLEEAREYLQKNTSAVGQDNVIADVITRASAAILSYLDRRVLPAETAQTKTFEWPRTRVLSLAPEELRAATSVMLDPGQPGETPLIEGTDFILAPVGRRDGAYTQLRFAVSLPTGDIEYFTAFDHQVIEVTGDWGWTTIPDDVKHACIVTVLVWMRREVQAYTSTFSLDENRIERPEGLPSHVRALLDRYRRSPVP